MSWYDTRFEASCFGHHITPAHTGEHGTYLQRREREQEEATARYRERYLNGWLKQLYAMGGGK